MNFSFYSVLRKHAPLKVMRPGLTLFLVTLCLLAAPYSAFSQTPGGVNSNLKLWLKADAGVTVSGGGVSDWEDQSINDYTVNQLTTSARPGFTASSSLFNCNPSVDFDLVDDGMATTVLMYNRPYTFFIVYNSTSTSTAARRAIQGDNNWLIGPYQNNVSFHPGPFVEVGQIPSNIIPSISTASSSAGTTNNAFFYYNGENRTPAGVSSDPGTPGRVYLGAAGAYPSNRFGGSMAEVIAYTRQVSPTERNKIESYLAIKYGISLDQTAPIDYTSSDGTKVWDYLFNGVYNNNIFGIGRDSGSGLEQLGSASANTDLIRLDNPSALADGDFLLLSDNGMSSGAQVQPGLPGGAVAASSLIWSTSKTGTVGTVDISIANSTANNVLLLDNNNDGIFETAISPTSTVAGVNTYAGVSLDNYAKLKIGYLEACFPGGVGTDLKLWLKAEDAAAADGKVHTWPDFSGNGADFSQDFPANQPELVDDAINGNPVVNFTSDPLTNPEGVTGTDVINDVNIYLVDRVNTSSGNTNFFNNPVVSGNLSIFLPFSNTVYWRPRTPDVTVPFASIPDNKLPRIYSFHASTTSGQTYPGVKNVLASNNRVFASSGTFNGFTGAVGTTSLGTSVPNSNVAEFLVYPGAIDAAQHNKIQSYLAVKYGISLDQTTPTNYTSSNGTVVWDAAANGAYSNNIFGIGIDETGCLDQRSSVSVNTDRVMITNPSGLVNNNYLLLSDNDLSTTPVAESGLPGGATLATPLAWNVSKTGTVGTVDLTIISDLQGAILLIDNNNDGIFETAVPAASQIAGSDGFVNTFPGVSLNNSAKLKLGYECLPALNNVVTMEYLVTPTLTTCSGTGTFTIRVKNLSPATIDNMIFRDSLPPGISYVPGSVSGTGVTFGANIMDDRVVTFNIATIPSSGFVDVSFDAAVACDVSTDAASITNIYQVIWDCSFSMEFTTPSYPILFPSLSLTLDNPNTTVGCYSPFVRTVTICNGGFGSVDSVTVSDTQGGTSLVIQNFSAGTVSGAGTPSGQTVLKAADFMTVGNGDGKLDQNECITLNDTLLVVGGATPIAGNMRADWGCNATRCMNGTTNNTVLVNTIVTSGGGTMGEIPSLTRTLSIISDIKTDSAGQLYNRLLTYQYVIKNNSTAVANDVRIHPAVTGLKYIDRDSIWASRNGEERYHPNFQVVTGGFFWANPAQYSANVEEPYPFPGFDQPSNTQIFLNALEPGDSVVVTFVVGTAGPVTKYKPLYQNFCTGSNPRDYCNTCYAARLGPSVGGVVDVRTYWRGLGCPGDLYQVCRANFPNKIYNGRDAEPIDEYTPGFGYAHWLARFSNFQLIDSTDLDRERCAYGEDTLRLLFKADVMDLPFFSDRSQFYIKIKTNGGIAWDGDLGATFGRLSSWSNEPWQADRVEDKSAIDSTILVYFKRSDLPPTALNTFNTSVINSYSGGDFELAIHLVNQCPGPAVRRVYMTRFFDIDSTNTEPGIESGNFDFQAGMEWNSICPGPCIDGVQVLDFDQRRSTFGAPDNNSDGVADASGSLNLDVIEDKRLTWSDTLEVNYRMVVRTTKPGGVPYLYMKSTIDYVSLPAAITCNEFLEKDFPKITLTRPGVGVFNAVGNSRGVNTDNTYLVDLSLQGGNGVTIPGITSYQDGDTIDFVQNLTYYEPHYGWDVIEWNFLHVPYTSLVADPVTPEQFKCDSVICRFETVDMTRRQTSSLVNGGPSCGTTNVVRIGSLTQVNESGCNNSPFPGEVRNILAPTYMKFVNPANSRWTITSVRAYLNTNIDACIQPVNDVLPPSLYFYSGDTLMLDLKAIHAFYGYDTEVSNLYSYSQFDLSMTYTPPPNLVDGCQKDHTDIARGFSFFTDYTVNEGLRLDSTTLINVGGGVTAELRWPGPNNNSFTQYAGSSISVSNPNVVLPVQYNKGTSLVYGNDFIAIPPAFGIVVDSIVDQVTGNVVPTVPGSNIWQVGYIPANSNRRFNIHTRVTICSDNVVNIYADRTPCTGYPESWEDYVCQSNARRTTFSYVTFQGELQMVDSLFTPLKDLCIEDTIQFRVINSQTQDANSVKVSFKMPQHSFPEPGHARLKLGSADWISVADPILENGVYSWTLPITDTLYNVTTNPENIMLLQVGYNTECNYTSGSQILSSIAGKVGCGDITSLFNTNPPPLSIIGAPTLSYFTNPTITVEQIDDCVPGAGYNYGVYLLVSGDVTGATDTVRVTLPDNYGYQSYNPAAAGSNNAPTEQPVVLNLPDGTTQLSWQVPPDVMPGETIEFTFQYEESVLSNKCEPSPEQVSRLSTIISTGVYCVTIDAICPVGIENGVDTVVLQSFKPSITPTAAATFTQGCDNEGKKSYLDVTGMLTNNGSADLLAGTDVIMEVFLDMDNSGTVTAGDISFDPLVYDQGLEVDSSYSYTYMDSIAITSCVDCAGKRVLLRISSDPDMPTGSSQCL